MRALLIIYIIVINLTGFFIMGIDKRRARRGGWRIREKTLFIIALLFGSIGILAGMYVFRHKTKHLSFSIGIPTIMVLQFLLIGLLFSWSIRRMKSPSQAVENELTLIHDLDDKTIQSFISYDNLMNEDLASGEIDDKTADAVRLFFENFEYHIHNEVIKENTATVSVSITNIDMHALAQDLCREILRQSVDIYHDESDQQTDNYYHLLYETLSSNTYEPVVTTAYFHLQKDDAGWIILADETLEDELVSGFISYMNDPKILPASEVLSIHLDALKELSTAQWADYLGVSDVFSTYNAQYYPLIDEEYISQIAEAFDYEILKCKEDGNTADAVVRIKSIDMTNVLEIYKEKLLAYAATTRSIRDDAAAFSDETSRLLLESLQENDKTTSTDIDLTFYNNGTVWDIWLGNDFTNALMGNMKEAIDAFNEVTQESQIMNAVP